MYLLNAPKKQRNEKTCNDSSNPTKRIILSQVNSIYDPRGLAGPSTVRAKILMRELWGIKNKLGWDDAIHERYKQYWKQFCQDVLEMNNIKFKRCVEPKDAENEQPVPVHMIDGNSTTDDIDATLYYQKIDSHRLKKYQLIELNCAELY